MTAKSQTILITGATSGIGRDAALYLASRGHRVIATGRSERALSELREAGLTALRMDVTDAASIARAVRDVDALTDGDGLDVLINNAGYGLFGPLEVLSDEDVRAQFETNVFGLLAVTRAFLPRMRERGAGKILNVSSVGGRMTFPLGGAYNATKYAVESMSDALRVEVAQFGVSVVLIEPGYIKTNFTGTTVSLAKRYADERSPYANALALMDSAESGLERFAASPRAVSKAMERAIRARRPRARYVAPWINAFGPWFGYLLPTRLLDWVFARAAGLRPAPAPRALPAGA
ncbi:MAG: SDR family oxidoreductase [Sandaracinaceae bacterium]|nr:SDR family oxidoreductase [Sandaracinaceae bacterium]